MTISPATLHRALVALRSHDPGAALRLVADAGGGEAGWVRVVALRRLGDHAAAVVGLEEAERAHDAAPEPSLAVRLARQRLALAGLDSALERLEAMEGSPEGVELAFELSWKAGRLAEAVAALTGRWRREGCPEALGVRLADILVRRGDPERALEVVAGYSSPGALAVRLGAQVFLDDRDGAVATGRALASHRPDEVVEAWLRLGAADALETTPFPPGVRRELDAHLSLWRGAPVDDEASPAWLRGAALARDGRPAEALAFLEDPPHPEARVWRAEALLALGRTREALQEAERATSEAQRPLTAGHALRLLCLVAEGRTPPHRGARRELAHRLVLGVGPTFVAELQAARAAWVGNRSEGLTWLREGRLVPAELPEDPRHAARRCQLLLHTRRISEARQAFDVLVERLGGDPLTRTYRGELALWVGDGAAAQADFAEAIRAEPQTVWAWIGLGASELLAGHAARALATWDEGVAVGGGPGPTMWVYRAEALRRLGRVDEAVADLRRALVTSPNRLGTWINLGLAEAERGRPEVAEALLADLREQVLDLGPLPAPAVPALEALLAQLGGNRSSTLVTRVHGDWARFVPWRGPKRARVAWNG